MNELTLEQIKEMLLFTAERMIASKDYLTRVDSVIGDGDHGIGMENGFLSIKEAIGDKTFASVNELYKEAGMAMLNSMGGASGVIFSSLFLGGMKELPELTVLDGESLVKIWEGGLAAIQKRGGAKPGDKTMVDALEPAVKAMEAAYRTGNDICVMLKKAMVAAEKGMEETKQYMAKFGRAKSLMERAIGYQDAGATSTFLMIKAMYEYVSGISDKKDSIVIGCDNAAIDLKLPIISFLEGKGIQVEDVGCCQKEDSTTYPKIAERVCEKIIESGYTRRGILLCGTGIGMAICANKFKGIRAAVCHDGFSTERSVLSNNCNVLCMGERVIGFELAKKNLNEWLELKFVPGPSSAKIEDIAVIERMNMK